MLGAINGKDMTSLTGLLNYKTCIRRVRALGCKGLSVARTLLRARGLLIRVYFIGRDI